MLAHEQCSERRHFGGLSNAADRMSFVGCVQLVRCVEQSICERRLRKRWRNRIHPNAQGCELRSQGTGEALNGSLCSSDRGVEGHTGLHCHRTKQDDG